MVEPPNIDGRVARAERLRGERRAQILAACRHVFAAKGYHGASIKDILDQAHIARATFYAHFDSKQAVLQEILTEFLDRLRATLQPVDVNSDVSNNEQLRGNVSRALAMFEADEDLARLVLHQATGVSPELDAKLEQFYASVAAMIQRSLDTGHALGLVRDSDRPLWSRFILGALKEVTGVRLQRGAPVDGAQLGLAILDFVLPAVRRN